MKNLFLFLLLSLLSLSAFAQQKQLEPVINFLRSTPAYVSGTITFNGSATLYTEGGTLVKILPNKPISFTIAEDYVSLYLDEAIYVQCYYMKVNVKSVAWSPRKGMETKSELNADITGLSRGTISRQVADVLNEMFGAKLQKANILLKQVRKQKTVASSMTLARAMLDVFKTTTNAKPIVLPSYRGELSLGIVPATDKAFNLYGMRVGVKANDTNTVSVNFVGNMKGISPNGVSINSGKGIDINSGTEFKAMARLVFNQVELNAGGVQMDLHLGASEVLGALMSLAELAARKNGYMGQSCQSCYELATLPPLRVLIEKKLRIAILQQVDSVMPMLKSVNVSPNVISAFKRREACNINGLSCMQECDKINGVDDQRTCSRSCQSKANKCLK